MLDKNYERVLLLVKFSEDKRCRGTENEDFGF